MAQLRIGLSGASLGERVTSFEAGIRIGVTGLGSILIRVGILERACAACGAIDDAAGAARPRTRGATRSARAAAAGVGVHGSTTPAAAARSAAGTRASSTCAARRLRLWVQHARPHEG